MSAYDGDYSDTSLVAIDDIEPPEDELDLIEKEGLPPDLFDEEEYEIFPNGGVDAFNADPDPFRKYYP